MSRPMPSFGWPAYELVLVNETVVVRLVDSDVVVPNSAACKRYGFSQSHLDRLTAAGMAPALIMLGLRRKGRLASLWYEWEQRRTIRPVSPALPAPAPAAVPEPGRGRGRPRRHSPALAPPPVE